MHEEQGLDGLRLLSETLVAISTAMAKGRSQTEIAFSLGITVGSIHRALCYSEKGQHVEVQIRLIEGLTDYRVEKVTGGFRLHRKDDPSTDPLPEASG